MAVFKVKGPNGETYYRGQVFLGYDSNRKQIFKTVQSKKKADAERRLAEARKQHDNGINIAPQKLTVGEYLKEWLDNTAKNTVRDSTFRSYCLHVNQRLIPEIGEIPLRKLSPDRVQQYLNKLSATVSERTDRTMSARSVQYTHAVLRKALNQALKWQKVTRNVALLVTPPRVRRTEIKPFDANHAREFLRHIKGHSLEGFFMVSMMGLRAGEVAGLRDADIDFEHRVMTIRRQIQRVDGDLKEVELKTDKSRRKVSIPYTILAAITEQIARRQAAKLKAKRRDELKPLKNDKKRWDDTGYLFTSRRGTPLDPVNVSHQFQLFLDEHPQLPRIRLHDLRHTAASLLLAKGASPHEVKETLGHSQISVTMNLYAHLYDEARESIAAKLDEVFNPPAPESSTKVLPTAPARLPS